MTKYHRGEGGKETGITKSTHPERVGHSEMILRQKEGRQPRLMLLMVVEASPEYGQKKVALGLSGLFGYPTLFLPCLLKKTGIERMCMLTNPRRFVVAGLGKNAYIITRDDFLTLVVRCIRQSDQRKTIPGSSCNREIRPAAKSGHHI